MPGNNSKGDLFIKNSSCTLHPWFLEEPERERINAGTYLALVLYILVVGGRFVS